MTKNKNCTAKFVLISAALAMNCSLALANDSAQPAADGTSAVSPAMQDDHGLLFFIPRMIDAVPTFLPGQSDASNVPSTAETEDSTWTDRQQKSIRNWADRTANKIDNWFGDPDPKHPASATLRVLLDSSWNKHDGYEAKPRIRGRIKLPTLEKKVSLVFGDDSLDNELSNNNAITNENPQSTTDKRFDKERAREDNSSFALRWSDFSKRLPFDADFDLGIRSGDDIYVRIKAKRDWDLENYFKFHAEQIYRYGIDSENYLRTNLELAQYSPNRAMLANQFNLTYADAQDDDLTWNNFTFRQHKFFHEHTFSYGLYSGGFVNNNDLRLNSWGPYVSWRQPFLREWFYIQGDLNYLNDHRDDRSHFIGALVRLEALF